MDPVIQKAYEAASKGQSYAFATIVEATAQGTARKSGSKLVVLNDGTVFGSIGGGIYEHTAIQECLKAIRNQKPELLNLENFGKKGQPICGGKFSVFVEPFAGTKHLIICGAGHIGLALSVLGKMLNFKVTVLDNRKEFASKKRFPHVDQILTANPASQLRKIPINENTFIMIVTHGHTGDFSCLKAVVNSPAAYIGVIGSKTKREKFFKNLQGNKKNPRIFMPAGLDIGSQTPEEIAVAIMAEIIGKYNKDWQNTGKFQTKNRG